MMTSLLALLVLLGSALLVLSNLRLVAQDTLQVLRDVMTQLSLNGRLAPNLAFGMLWILIFTLSYA
ncbi:hypothetical protein [Puniceibacterium sp. IMCC21224]|uniref:hypothetical protein n=1 Tax=Puniceibacterium sp. IMCC21224 TaxID=1618204 RepID=UPI00064DD136|nr:hypothetical protein [Puniceibacterium sp. IMCC21224]KMK66751.1 hypothetical protein IMCC21224_111608 [Puniceibacterium sp. IMCC21224]